MTLTKLFSRLKGGTGSGNFGHGGRPGKHGGSTQASVFLLLRKTKSLSPENIEELKDVVSKNDNYTKHNINKIKEIKSNYPYGGDWPKDVQGMATKDGTLYINFEGTTPVKYIFAHELGHVVGYKMPSQLRNEVENMHLNALNFDDNQLDSIGFIKTGFETLEKRYGLKTSDEFIAESFRIKINGTESERNALNEVWGGELDAL